MVAAAGDIGCRNNRVSCCAQDDLHANRQRGEAVLLRNTEERKIPLQTHGQNARQVLLHGNVTDKAD